MSREYHVNQRHGRDWQEGTRENPFRTISRAASVAMPGDIVIVHEGVYREWVKQENSGISEFSRITCQAVKGN